jgi:translation initiation factor IF-1
MIETGKIIEVLPEGNYRVERPSGAVIRCYTAGKMRLNHIRCQIGDTVEIKIPEQGEIGTVVRRK